MDSLSRERIPSPDAFALLVLDGLPGVGPVTVRRLVERFGTADDALTASHRDFAACAGSKAARARSDRALREEVQAALARAEQEAIDVVTWRCPDYPQPLAHLTDPPPVLFTRGRLDLLRREPKVTVVGARRATSRARDVSERLGRALARSGATVVSGLALGVDGAVHEGVLRAGGSAIGVLGTGVDVVYPRAHRRLFEALLEHGLVMSEFMPGVGAAPHHFPRRNRILAALSPTTVVVEAGSRSGSLITVDHALDVGREVWAVPGPIDSSACVGSNRLLGDGAKALVSIDAFAAEICGTVVLPPPLGRPRTGSGPERKVLAALANDTLLVDEVAAIVDLPASTALAILTTMELHGEVERMPGMRFRRAA